MVLSSLLAVAAAVEVPSIEHPPELLANVEWVANVDVDPVPPVSFAGMDIALESTRLEEASAKLGAGELRHEGDGGESLTWLCYRVAEAGSSEVVWLSSSEMGGGDVIDGIAASRQPADAEIPAGCTDLDGGSHGLRMANGVGLGSSEARLRQVYGAPRVVGDLWIYAFDGKVGRFDVMSSISFRMLDGHVVAIDLSRTTTD